MDFYNHEQQGLSSNEAKVHKKSAIEKFNETVFSILGLPVILTVPFVFFLTFVSLPYYAEVPPPKYGIYLYQLQGDTWLRAGYAVGIAALMPVLLKLASSLPTFIKGIFALATVLPVAAVVIHSVYIVPDFTHATKVVMGQVEYGTEKNLDNKLVKPVENNKAIKSILGHNDEIDEALQNKR